MIASSRSARVKPRVSLLDLWINKFSDSDVVALIKDAIQDGEHLVIANHNLHSVYLWYHEARMREFYALADYIHIDGMSLVMLGNVTGVPLKRKDRATSLDFLPLLLQQAVENGWRLFYLGSRPGVAEKAAVRLRKEHPGLQIRTRSGHFDASKNSKENRDILEEINSFAPHILFVGMGMPRQEIWILENQKDSVANAILPVGALMDYLAGEIPTAPRWLASIYLEWFYRLVSEPKRLWRRYLVEPWFVFGQALKHQLKFGHRYLATQDSRND